MAQAANDGVRKWKRCKVADAIAGTTGISSNQIAIVTISITITNIP
jgi:hypothetical protein